MVFCKKCDQDFKKVKSGVCEKCYNKYFHPKKICSNCKKEKTLKNKFPPLCSSCYSKQYNQPKRQCSGCDKLSKIISNGLCSSCLNYTQPKRKCNECGKNSKIYLKKECVCNNCYRKNNYKVKFCSLCKKTKRYNLKGRYGFLCLTCERMFQKDICTSCKEEKYLTDGLCSSCCSKEYKRKKIFCISCRKIKTSHKKIYEFNVCNACYKRIKYNNDPNFKIKSLLRGRLTKALKAKQIRKKYKIDYLSIINHLGEKPGPDYHIDHIIPLCAFNLLIESEVLKAFAPENHRWIPAKENLSKGGKYNVSDYKNFMEK